VNEDIQRLVLAAFADLADGHGIFPSRRERIATALLQGMLANPDFRGTSRENVVSAVKYADALIAELDKPKGDG
jgi:hypothetical protein